MKRLFAILSIFLILMLIASCGSTAVAGQSNGGGNNNENASEASDGSYKFGVTFQTLDNTHWLRLEAGLRSAMRPQDTLVVMNAEYDSEKQVRQVEDFVAQECDLIFVVPVDSSAIQPCLAAAKREDVPIIAVDIEPDSRANTDTVVITDNYAAGQQMGEALLKKLEEVGGQAKVGVISFDTIEAARLRIRAFKDTVRGHDNVEIVIEQSALPSTEEGLPVLENMLQAKPEITDFVLINDLQAFAAIQVCKASNRPDIGIYAVDGNLEATKAILEGTMSGTSAQFPDQEGAQAMELAYQLLNGETVEEAYLVEPRWIEQSNAQEYLDSIDS